MYVPETFQEKRTEVLHAAIRDIGFATLVTQGETGLEATHLPLALNAESAPLGVLRGHMAHGNPQWRRIKTGSEVLAIFQGPHAYVSPSWYPSKQDGGRVAPTWNYLAVHAHGVLEVIGDPAELADQLAVLTARHETGRPSPWAMSDAPADYIQRLLRGIVGVRLTITRLEGAWKLGQNRSAADFAGVIEGLTAEGGAQAEAAAAMARLNPAGS